MKHIHYKGGIVAGNTQLAKMIEERDVATKPEDKKAIAKKIETHTKELHSKFVADWGSDFVNKYCPSYSPYAEVSNATSQAT